MSDQIPKCTACSGRGYHRCECWPGDCICGYGDETCEECGGDGFIEPGDHQGCYCDEEPAPKPTVDDIDRCPICLEPFSADDICATDIEMGTVHAECLKGCEVVDLETGEPTNKPLSTYPYLEVTDPPPQDRDRSMPAECRAEISGSSVTMEIEGTVDEIEKAIRQIEGRYPPPAYGTWFNWPPGLVFTSGENKGKPNTYLAPKDIGGGRWIARGNRSTSSD